MVGDVVRDMAADAGSRPGGGSPGRGPARIDTVPRLGDLAASAVRVPSSIRLAALDSLFRRDAALRWVVTDGSGPPVLVSRARCADLTAGRRDRRRIRRARLADLFPAGGPVLPADLPVALAAAELLPLRTGDEAVEAVMVAGPDGELGVAPLPAVFERAASQALRDPLTGLPNRLFLLQWLARSADDGDGVLCSIGLDRFTDVNDDLGYAAGDELLAEFASRLRSVAGADDLVVRLGGDEFAIWTTSAPDAA
ncbi:MAG: diguanylate cyclase domain-containing protein, partial [Actinomycetes bacterium]